jgi:serine/threonine protein kinase
MNGDVSGNGDRDARLAELILQYIDAVEAGEPVNRSQFVTANPEFRRELEEFFANHDQVERVAAPIRVAAVLDDGLKFGTATSNAMGTPVSPAIGGRPDDRPLGQLGEFRLLREIGRGGMGIVYEAEQLSLQRRVALKVLPFAAAIDAKHVLRFKNEALAAGMLNHAHIVPVYSVGNERGVHFYSMQLVEGQSLAALIAELRQQAATSSAGSRRAADPVPSVALSGADEPSDGTAHELVQTDAAIAGNRETDVPFQRELSTQHARRHHRFFRTAARLMLQAAEALQHAHESGIVHRDIKPANLLVDVNGQIHITDFGLAQIRSEVGLTRTGDTPGTLRYMSPEQAAGKRTIVDHRTDIYSLGATFYELLTLSPIFEGQDVQELLAQVFDAEPKPLRSLDPFIPVELETIVLKATNKTPDDRYHAAGDLAADLQRFLDNQPILARPPSLIDRARKWARRHPSAAIAGLVVMVLVSAVSVTSFVLIDGAYRRERLRADEAEAQFQLARRSVDELVRVSEEELAYDPNAESVRRRLLTSVLAYYQEFIKRREDDPQARETLAEASARVETILNGLRALRAKGQIKLLSQTSVVEELQLSEAQQAEARELLDRVEDLWQETFRDIGQVSAAELDRRFIEKSLLNEADLKAMLTPDQLRRLHQLDLQADVAAALREPEVIAAIKLTDSQRDQIRTIEQQEMARWRAGHHHKTPETGEDATPASAPVPSKNERILEVLTPEQRVAWRELTGRPLAGIQR